MLDLMRLPLGILSGMGFIGAGAILRKGRLISGVTTAATLWFVTVMGLCLGGGQTGLGLAALGLGILILAGLKWADRRLPQRHYAVLALSLMESGPHEKELSSKIQAIGFYVVSYSLTYTVVDRVREMRMEVYWYAPACRPKMPDLLKEFDQCPGLLKLEWKPVT